jgi:transposase InsO family protein
MESPDIAPIIDYLQGRDISAVPHNTYKRALALADQCLISDGVLYRVDPLVSKANLQNARPQLVLPSSMQTPTLQLVHESIGHTGIGQLIRQVRRHFWFPRYTQLAQQIVQSCPKCQQYRTPAVGFRGAVRDRSFSYQPFTNCQLDLLSMPISKEGFRYLALFICEYSKYCIAFPLKNKTPEDVIDGIYNHVILPYSTPMAIHTDQGGEFVSRLNKAFYTAFGIHHRQGTPYYPQSQGLVERHNRTFLMLIRPLMHERYDMWPKFVPQVLSIMNNTPHESTAYLTPHFLIHGWHRRHPFDMVLNTPDLANIPLRQRDTLNNIIHNHMNAQKLCIKAAKQVHQRIKQKMETKAKLQEYDIGDQVMVFVDRIQRGKGINKVRPKWVGPFTVMTRTPHVVTLRENLSGKVLREAVNIARTKLYHSGLDLGAQPIPIEQLPEYVLNLEDLPKCLDNFEYFPRNTEDILENAKDEIVRPKHHFEPPRAPQPKVKPEDEHVTERAKWFNALTPDKKSKFLQHATKLHNLITTMALSLNLSITENGFVPVDELLPHIPGANIEWLKLITVHDPQRRFLYKTTVTGPQIAVTHGYTYPLLKDMDQITNDAVLTADLPLYLAQTPINALTACTKGLLINQSLLNVYYGKPKNWSQFVPAIPKHATALLKLNLSNLLAKGFAVYKTQDQQRYLLARGSFPTAIPINRHTVERVVYHSSVPLAKTANGDWIPVKDIFVENIPANHKSTFKVVFLNDSFAYLPFSSLNTASRKFINIQAPLARSKLATHLPPVNPQTRYNLRTRTS